MIIIKMNKQDGSFHLVIEGEEWSFKEKERLMKILNELIDYKDKFGRIK